MSDDAIGLGQGRARVWRRRPDGRAASRRTRARRRSGGCRPSCTVSRPSIPFIVLLLGVVIFAFAAPGKFLSPLNLSVVLQQVTIIAILGIAQTLVILTAGIDLSRRRDHDPLLGGDGPHRRRLRRAGRSSPSRSGCSSASPAAAVNGLIVTRLQAAALHRDARHLEHLRRAQHLVFAQRDDPAAGHRGGGAVPAMDRQLIKLYDSSQASASTGRS